MESYKFRKYAFHKTRIFFGKFFGSFGQFSENLKIHRKSWENGFGPINEK